MVHILCLNYFLNQACASFSSPSPSPPHHKHHHFPQLTPHRHRCHLPPIKKLICASMPTSSFLCFHQFLPNFPTPISSSPAFSHHHYHIPSFAFPTIALSPTPTCIYSHHHLSPTTIIIG